MRVSAQRVSQRSRYVLRLVERLEAHAPERRLLGVPDARLDFAFAIRIADAWLGLFDLDRCRRVSIAIALEQHPRHILWREGVIDDARLEGSSRHPVKLRALEILGEHKTACLVHVANSPRAVASAT